jgi:YVTN family beta-propeller protein
MFLSVAGVEAGAAPAVAAPTAPSYAVTATIPVGAGPAPVAVNSRSGRLYVGNQTDRTVSVVNTADNAVGATIPVGGSPLALAVNPVTDKTYATTATGGSGAHQGQLVEIDHTNTPIASRQLQQDGDGPHFGAAVNSVTDTVYVSHFYGGSVSGISGATLAPTATFGAGPIVFGVAVNELTNTVYVTNLDSGAVTVVNGSTHGVLATVPVGGRASSVAVDPSRHTAYVNASPDTVVVIDTTTNQVVAHVRVGHDPRQVAVDPSAGVVYVANNQDNTVSVIDEATNTVTATVPVGNAPSGVAVDADTGTAYVTNTASNTVSVIRTIDTTAPTVTASATSNGSPYTAGTWTNHDVSVHYTCTDNLGGSGVASVTPDQTVGTDGDGQSATGSCTDNAGNTASATFTGIRIDKAPPTVTYSGNAGSYTVDQQVSITCTPADTLSGVASSTCANTSGPAYSFGLGSHTLTATATDNAGNQGSATTTFNVQVSSGSLANLVTQFSTNTGVATGLCDKLTAASQAAARGQDKAKSNILGAFDQQVSAQTGKALTPEQASILTNLVAAL